MSSIKTLYNRLQTFINENKNGIVAFCGSSSIKDAFEYMVYIHPLEYVYVVTDASSRYFPVSMKDDLQRELKYFSNSNDCISLSDAGLAEKSFFDSVINSLLWEMAHEINTANPDESLNDRSGAPFTLNSGSHTLIR